MLVRNFSPSFTERVRFNWAALLINKTEIYEVSRDFTIQVRNFPPIVYYEFHWACMFQLRCSIGEQAGNSRQCTMIIDETLPGHFIYHQFNLFFFFFQQEIEIPVNPNQKLTGLFVFNVLQIPPQQKNLVNLASPLLIFPSLFNFFTLLLVIFGFIILRLFSNFQNIKVPSLFSNN